MYANADEHRNEAQVDVKMLIQQQTARKHRNRGAGGDRENRSEVDEPAGGDQSKPESCINQQEYPPLSGSDL